MRKHCFAKFIAVLLAVSCFVTAAPVAFAQTVPDVDNTNTVQVTQAGQQADVALSLKKIEQSETKIFSATVSAEIPVYQDTDGQVLVADKARIENKSNHDIQVSKLDVTAQNGWTVVPFTTNMSSVADGTKQVALQLRDDPITGAGTANITASDWTIQQGDLHYVNMQVKMPKNIQQEEQFATLSFTLDWADSEDPDKHTVIFQAGANGSLTGSTTVQATSGEKVKFPSTKPGIGYKFDQWVDQDGNPITEDTPITKNLTITALFKEDASDESWFTIENHLVTGFSPTYLALSDKPKKLKIPSEIDGQDVWGIGAGAFMGEKLPGNDHTLYEGVELKSDEVYAANAEITSVELPSCAVRINKLAFRGCRKLNTVVLNNVTRIEESAFNGCEALGILGAPLDLSKVETIGKLCFNSCRWLTVKLNETDGRFGQNAFLGCNKLTSAQQTYIQNNTYSYL